MKNLRKIWKIIIKCVCCGHQKTLFCMNLTDSKQNLMTIYSLLRHNYRVSHEEQNIATPSVGRLTSKRNQRLFMLTSNRIRSMMKF